MAFSMALPWSEGEEEMHRLLNVPEHDNPTSSMLTPQAAFMLQRAPLLAIGTVDPEGNPWTTLWGGEPGFSRPLGGSIVGTRTIVDAKNDPVVKILFGGHDDGEVIKEQGPGRMVGGLTIDLASRKRVKLYGRMVAGALNSVRIDDDEESGEDPKLGEIPAQAEVQLVVNIEQSLGNCPKYLNKKDIHPAIVKSKLLSDSTKLSPEALKLLDKADLFFISTSNLDLDMDTNHRGGPPGFVRVLSNGDSGAEIVYPEYSGNRLYQSLGNLRTNHKAGIVFPDFETGNVLYVTGSTEILIGREAAKILPRTNLAVKIRLTQARFVQQGLPFRGIPGEYSPYNPNVRLLAKEGNMGAAVPQDTANTARLIKKTQLTPTINRYRFSMDKPAHIEAGQWVAMDLSHELDMGYSHMRDDDPKSINDDFIRTFTVSSPPKPSDSSTDTEFEITARTIGPVTHFLDRLSSRRALDIPLRGFGGDFQVDVENTKGIIPFIAGGVGITPLLGQLPTLPLDRLRLLWTVRLDDLGLVTDTFQRHPGLAQRTSLFVTGSDEGSSKQHEKELAEIKSSGANVETRRMEDKDVDAIEAAEKYYLCAGKELRNILLGWLKNRQTVHEDFDY